MRDADQREVLQTERAVPKIPMASHTRRRSLLSASEAQSKTNTPGRFTMELMLAIRSTGTPALARRNGRGVDLKPTIIPSGRMSKLNSQGTGHRRGSRMERKHISFGIACRESQFLRSVVFFHSPQGFAGEARNPPGHKLSSNDSI